MGYSRAGFEVVGVDHLLQKHYPFEFHCADAFAFLEAHGHEFDVIHASPPCQAYSATKTIWNNTTKRPDLLPATREALVAVGKPWVIENVPGAPMNSYFILCGSMFWLTVGEWELRRHRLFESNAIFPLVPECQHAGPVMGVYGGHARDRRRTLGVYGNGGTNRETRGAKATIVQAREIMGIDWMTTAEISQAIPPAYTEWIGRRLLEILYDPQSATAE